MRISDWSSDACSSDLPVPRLVPLYAADGQRLRPSDRGRYPGALSGPDPVAGRTVRGDAPPDGGCGTAPKAGGEGRSADQNCADRSYRNRRRRRGHWPAASAQRRASLTRDRAAIVSAMPALAFEHVSHAFGDLLAVDDLSFGLERGEVVCLLGPSGCGKTTALRVAAGLEPLQQGRVIIDGEVVAGEGRERKSTRLNSSN